MTLLNYLLEIVIIIYGNDSVPSSLAVGVIMRRITIKDIAQIAGVSPATVSRALNGSTEISEQVRNQIVDISKREGYRVNSIARSLIKNKTNMIGLIVPDVTNTFYAELAFGIEKHAYENNYKIMLFNSRFRVNEIQDLFDLLIGNQVEGIILAGSHDESKWLVDYPLPIPLVLLGDTAQTDSGALFHSVSIDNYAGGYMAGQYLCDLGHKKIACLGVRTKSITHRARFSGFCKALDESDIIPVVLENCADSSSIEAGYQLGKRLLDNVADISAIFALADSIAIGMMQAAGEKGVRIPEDISLLGFDNVTYARLPRIDLSTVDQCTSELARETTDILLSVIENTEKSETIHRLIQPKLVMRESCAEYINNRKDLSH